jgi:hypothetical protein
MNRPLLTVLTSKGMSALDAFGLLRLVEARDTPQCRAGSTLAFTQPGAPMIRICSLQFRARFAQDRRSAEISTGQEWEYGDPKYEDLFPDPRPDSADGFD